MSGSTFPHQAALATALLAAAPVLAQQAEGTLRPIVVTPTPGLAQEAFDTPASVDVVPGAAVRNGQLQVNLSESLVRVPGVTALNRQNYAQDLQISIRGFGARASFGVRGLRLYTDGIPATAPDGQSQVSHFDLASADRIEVLRGPFSALYGNSSGGVISLFTADGGPGQLAELGTAFGGEDTRRVHARVAGETGDWNYHLNALRFDTDGWRAHSAAQRTGFNGKLRYRVSGDTRLTLVANAMDMPQVQDPQGLTRAEMEADPRQASPSALQFNTRKSVDQLQGGAILEHRLDAAQSVQVTAWRGARGTEQFLSIPPAAQTPPTQSGGVISLARDFHGVDARWTGKMRLADRPLALTVGASYEALQEDRKGYENFVGPQLGVMGGLRRDEDNRVRGFDQYAQGTWTSGRVSLTAGVRHSSVRFHSRDRYIAPGNGDDSGQARYAATTPVLGVVWHATDSLNLYASGGRGFETPTFNELSYRPGNAPGLNFDLRPAESRQWELGLKAEPAPRWRLNAALFQARTADEIVVLTNSGGRAVFQNAGGTRRRGVEALLAGEWGRGWSLLAVASWLDARYTAPFSTCVGTPCPAPNTVVPAGNRMPGIPRSSAFVQLAWEHRPWGMQAAVEYRHLGRMAVNDLNTDAAPGADLFSARLQFEQRHGPWRLREFLRVDNLADRRHAGSVIVNAGNDRYFEPAPGRSWLLGVTAGYAF